MIKKAFRLLILICIFSSLSFITVYGSSEVINESINESLNVYDFNDVNSVLSNDVGVNIHFDKIVKDILLGDFDYSFGDIVNYIEQIIQGQYKKMMSLFFDLFILGIASAFIQNLTNSVKPKSTTSMGNYVCYIVLIHILATSFNNVMLITIDFLTFIENFTQAIIPILLGSLAFSGYIGTIYFAQPALVLLVYIISYLFKNVLVKFVFVIAIIEIVNGVTSKELLSNFCDIGNKIIKWCLRTTAIVYVTIMSLIKIGAPISDTLVKKGAKTAVGAIPVVGNTLQSAVDGVALVADATSNALLFGVVLICVIYGASYLINLVAYNIIFSITAVVIEPVAEKNIVKAIKGLTKYIAYLMSILGLSIMLLVVSAILLLG